MPNTARKLTTEELYLCDSGAQYLDGTTDITRTVSFGQPKAKEKVTFPMIFKTNTQTLFFFPAGMLYTSSEGPHCFMLSNIPKQDFWKSAGHASTSCFMESWFRLQSWDRTWSWLIS